MTPRPLVDGMNLTSPPPPHIAVSLAASSHKNLWYVAEVKNHIPLSRYRCVLSSLASPVISHEGQLICTGLKQAYGD